MSTPHNSAEKGQIAKTVLMPGIPCAPVIAETFLENLSSSTPFAICSATPEPIKAKRFSVMGRHGNAEHQYLFYELFSQYGVENIIRIGSAGAYSRI